MSYSKEGLNDLEAERAKLEPARRSLMLRAGRLSLRSASAQRILFEGALRRLKLIHLSTDLIFEHIPPDTNRPPPERLVGLVTLCLHSHFINVYGFLDCLAHVWVLEKNITQDNGKAIPRTKIGFGKKCVWVRASLSKDALAKLLEFDEWFEYLEQYRHSLAHRIPIYVPPNFVDPKNTDEYLELNRAWMMATTKDETMKLEVRMDAISHFKSLALFDLDEAREIFFHAQIIADLKTIESFASAIFRALEQ